MGSKFAVFLVAAAVPLFVQQRPPRPPDEPPKPLGSPTTQTPSQPDCGGRSNNPRTACQSDVDKMMAALPDKAPAKPQKPRKVLVLARATGYVHSSIPLAAKAVEALGAKTGAWTAATPHDAEVLNADTH